MTAAPLAHRLISALADHLRADLHLQQGVCALYDTQDREAVVIELPDHSDMAIVHCAIELTAHASGLHKRLLELNFRLDLLGGSWLALDDQACVRLCAQCPLSALDETAFCHWVVGFVRQVDALRPRLLELARAGEARPASLPLNRTRLS